MTTIKHLIPHEWESVGKGLKAARICKKCKATVNADYESDMAALDWCPVKVYDRMMEGCTRAYEELYEVREEFRLKLKHSAPPHQWSFCPYCGVETPRAGTHKEGCPGDKKQRWWGSTCVRTPGARR
jgi:hypothetical protein